MGMSMKIHRTKPNLRPPQRPGKATTAQESTKSSSDLSPKIGVQARVELSTQQGFQGQQTMASTERLIRLTFQDTVVILTETCTLSLTDPVLLAQCSKALSLRAQCVEKRNIPPQPRKFAMLSRSAKPTLPLQGSPH